MEETSARIAPGIGQHWTAGLGFTREHDCPRVHGETNRGVPPIVTLGCNRHCATAVSNTRYHGSVPDIVQLGCPTYGIYGVYQTLCNWGVPHMVSKECTRHCATGVSYICIYGVYQTLCNWGVPHMVSRRYTRQCAPVFN